MNMMGHDLTAYRHEIERWSNTQIGTFARNPNSRISDWVCPVCFGVKNPGYGLCLDCERYQREHDGCLADHVGMDVYAFSDPIIPGANASDQMKQYMYDYKDKPALYAGAARSVIEQILRLQIVCRWGCIADISDGVAPTAWATLPSTKGRHPHPLNEIMRRTLPGMPEIRLCATGRKNHRIINPDLFVVDGSHDPRLLDHVLLVDDTWTTGSNLQSASVALKQRYGVRIVTAFCVARYVNVGYMRGYRPQFLMEVNRSRFQGSFCPWHQIMEP